MTATPKGPIIREGVVIFGDASLSVWEESIPSPSGPGGFKARDAWELAFKRQVFARIVQTLNRLGWTCAIPQDYIQQYSLSFARDRRECSKGHLKGFLEVSGRTVTFKMWQGVNTPTRPDHGGRYESDLEGCMPYVIRLEMERTRRRIRDYLCNVFSDYTFDSKVRTMYAPALKFTAAEKIAGYYAESCHFKGVNWEKYKTQPGMVYNLKSGDGASLEHGQRVWFFDDKGRACEGLALYNINNMWWVVTGRYSYHNIANFNLFATQPENLRIKRNAKRRRARLESLLADAVKAMKFERAAELRDILFPKDEALFVVWHHDHQCYHRSGFRGYTKQLVDAGKFTWDEVKSWNRKPNEVRHSDGSELDPF